MLTPNELVAIMREEHRRPDGDFFPGVDLKAYAEKLLRKAEILVHYRGGKTLGLAAYYCHDVESLTGFLSLLWVSPEARGAGIACALMGQVIGVLEARRFHLLKLEVFAGNHRAISFYRRQGFEVIGSNQGSLIMGLALPRSQAEDGGRRTEETGPEGSP